jgi:hypothetical protein
MLRNKVNSTLLETLVMPISIELLKRFFSDLKLSFFNLKLDWNERIKRKKTIRKSDSNWVNYVFHPSLCHNEV